VYKSSPYPLQRGIMIYNDTACTNIFANNKGEEGTKGKKKKQK